MRHYGAERLADDGSVARLAERHAGWCRGQVESVHRQLAGQEEVDGVRRLDELWPNLRAAVDWACAADDADLACSLVEPIVGEVLLRSRQEIGTGPSGSSPWPHPNGPTWWSSGWSGRPTGTP